jgi:alpha-L-rhamnosidase
MSTPKLIRHGDIVHWPAHERDGYTFTSVVNAFYLRALEEMSQRAEVLGKTKDATKFSEQERTGQATFQENLYDPARGFYRDGVETNGISLL